MSPVQVQVGVTPRMCFLNKAVRLNDNDYAEGSNPIGDVSLIVFKVDAHDTVNMQCHPMAISLFLLRKGINFLPFFELPNSIKLRPLFYVTQLTFALILKLTCVSS